MNCSVEGCDKDSYVRTWCLMHYTRWRRRGAVGDASPFVHPSSPQRFWPRVIQDGDCWRWTGSHTTAGYGSFVYNGRGGYAHRYSYETLVGPIPAGLELDHLCRVRDCVNPAHLEPVTPQENKRRMAAINRRTECPSGHPYEGDNIVYEKDGSRKCRTCRRQRDRVRRKPRSQSPVGEAVIRLA